MNRAPHTGDRAAVSTAILAYLTRHPRASDTAAGICNWWLAEEGVTGSVDTVADVLEELVEQRLLLRVRLPDGAVIYRRGDARP